MIATKNARREVVFMPESITYPKRKVLPVREGPFLVF
jgi:hypothetical protein